ncbi:MAG: ABC transporter permease [Hyphomicrobiales bacterium]|nr:ABC transporter permease [Hyphomicrobiales bacterium]
MTDATAPSSRAASALRRVPLSLVIVVSLLALLIATGAVLSDRFATLSNFLNVFQQAAGLGFASLGQTLVILTGGIDLSVGAMISLTSNLTSGWIDGNPGRVIPVVLAVIALGGAIGSINGMLSYYLRIHPLIVTLGMAAVLQGTTLLYSLAPAGSVPVEFEVFAYGRIFGLSVAGLVMVGLFVVVGVFLHRTRTGSAIYAVGGDPHAAHLLGISVPRVMMLVYGLSGAFAAFTGIYFVSRMGSGDPWRGEGFELASITPVVVGGTVLTGGKGGVLGTLLGVYLISLLNNLLNFLDISTFYQWIIQGLIIITAVAMHVERSKDS